MRWLFTAALTYLLGVALSVDFRCDKSPMADRSSCVVSMAWSAIVWPAMLVIEVTK